MAMQFAPLPSSSGLLTQAWHIVKTKAKVVYPLVVLTYVPTGLVFVWAQFVRPAVERSQETTSALTIVAIIGVLAIIIYSIWVAAALYIAVIFEVSIGQAFSMALPRLRGYLWTSFVSGVICGLGFILLVIPGIVFSVWYAFAGVVFLVEGISGWAALKQSKQYVSGRWGAVASKLIFAALIYFVLYLVSIFLPPLERGIYTVVLALIYAPIFIAYQYTLYYALRQTMPAAQTHETPAQTIQTS